MDSRTRPGVPWSTKTPRLDALERAREADRRLDRLAARSAPHSADLPPRRRYETPESGDWVADLFARRDGTEASRSWRHEQRPSLTRAEERPRAEAADGINRRIDGLTRQLDQLARLNTATVSAAQRRAPQDEESFRKLAAAIARLDERLEQMIAEGRRAINDIDRRMSAFERTLASLRVEGPWREPSPAANPVDRPPVLDGEPAVPSMSRLPEAPHYTAAADGQQLSGLQRQIEQLTSRMDGVSFRSDLDQERPDATRRTTFQQDYARQRAIGSNDLDAPLR